MERLRMQYQEPNNYCSDPIDGEDWTAYQLSGIEVEESVEVPALKAQPLFVGTCNVNCIAASFVSGASIPVTFNSNNVGNAVVFGYNSVACGAPNIAFGVTTTNGGQILSGVKSYNGFVSMGAAYGQPEPPMKRSFEGKVFGKMETLE